MTPETEKKRAHIQGWWEGSPLILLPHQNELHADLLGLSKDNFHMMIPSSDLTLQEAAMDEKSGLSLLVFFANSKIASN